MPRPATTASASSVRPLSSVTGTALLALDARDELAGDHLDAVAAVELVHRLGHVGREEARPDPVLREHEPHRAARRRERRRELGADEAAAEHDEVRAGAGERAKAPVVGQAAEVHDVAAGVARKPPRAAPGREQELLVAVRLAARRRSPGGPPGRSRRRAGRGGARRRGRRCRARSKPPPSPATTPWKAAGGCRADPARRRRGRSSRRDRGHGSHGRRRRRSFRRRRSGTGSQPFFNTTAFRSRRIVPRNDRCTRRAEIGSRPQFTPARWPPRTASYSGPPVPRVSVRHRDDRRRADAPGRSGLTMEPAQLSPCAQHSPPRGHGAVVARGFASSSRGRRSAAPRAPADGADGRPRVIRLSSRGCAQAQFRSLNLEPDTSTVPG